MRVFLDTNVLVAASEESHVHHARAWPIVNRIAAGKDEGTISVHSLAEVYACLTRLPLEPRIHPWEAARIIADNLVPHFRMIEIGTADYLRAVEAMGSGAWRGALIYDALLLGCAERAGAERIYTFNVQHFRQLAGPQLAARICAP